VGSGAPLDQRYRNRLARMADQPARDADAAGDLRSARRWRQEAAFWRHGTPITDRLPRPYRGPYAASS
jgi:hypothetical protein